jgi:hypothetical protein
MLPHLGVFSTIEPIGASDILEKDCLIHLGYCIAPIFSNRSKQGTELGEIVIDKTSPSHKLRAGDFFVIPLTEGDHLLQIHPSARVNIGNGNGIVVEKQIIGGGCGLIVDCRGRPLLPDADPKIQADKQKNIMAALGISE